MPQKRTVADVTAILKGLQKIVSESIGTAVPGSDHAEGLTLDLSKIDFAKLAEEIDKKGSRERSTIQDIADLLEQRLAAMVATNPLQMDYCKKYQEIIADYNREKDRTTVGETCRRLMELNAELDDSEIAMVAEGLKDEEQFLFQLLQCDDLTKADRERHKQSCRQFLESLKR